MRIFVVGDKVKIEMISCINIMCGNNNFWFIEMMFCVKEYVIMIEIFICFFFW